ncbi:NAD-dependent epimerase/dehydratase family protein [Clostridium sp. FP2]|uniref:NAD-dependent epimerase/dehydratase family protein n=1 Tax=Clostridium sp. FP2 TaxID=2724481 RepID=UPI0013E99123|nr:NAD-dependent epimerase/dehydratase family protein [Clostridium sp. FP2]MBZ9624558.1 NAD-dependent epimerase/dehydratase family protein [Clostridium sp. FP2]
MKVLITGGAGFIGSHIVDLLLEKGYEVVVVDNLVHGKLENVNSNAEFYNMDIRNKELIGVFKIEKPDYVIHEASQINVDASIKDPINDASINIIGTLNILECCRICGVKKIIYPASAAIFGEAQYSPIDEKHPLNMLSPYGVTKHTVEHYLDVYHKLYGIGYVSLRCSNVYGPRQDSTGEGGVVAIFCEKLVNDNAPIIFGDGEQTRDFIYVQDVAKANLMALSSEKNGIYNVCSNSKTSINYLVRIINHNLNKNVEPIYESERLGDIKTSIMNYSKIFNALAWKPSYDIDLGIKETLKFYK